MPKFLANGVQVVDRALIDDVVARVVERFAPRRVVLFGSHARGDARPDSDIDLFIEMESPLRPVERSRAVLDLFGLRPWGLDVIVYTPDEVRERPGQDGGLLSRVEREGRTLYHCGDHGGAP